MHVYAVFLAVMGALFCAAAAILLALTAVALRRRETRRAAIYLGLTLLSCLVALGFYFARRLI